MGNLTIELEPQPISLVKLKEEREKEAQIIRQGELDDKARRKQQRYEEEQMKLELKRRQEKIEANKELVEEFTVMMDLGFHQSEDDFNISMENIIFVNHQELLENFEFYTGLCRQTFQSEKNFLINWQCIMHWIQTFNIAKTKEECMAICNGLQEISMVKLPFQDTLNMRNSLNYV